MAAEADCASRDVSMTDSAHKLAIGPEAWRDITLRKLRLAENLIGRGDRNIGCRKSLDPLPHMRDIGAQLSNEGIHKYCREVRVVVINLRQYVWNVNEEIKLETLLKESFEKALDYIRKDVLVNRESQLRRLTKPPREKMRDGADDLLNAELAHLLNSKKILEVELKRIQLSLQNLSHARERVKAVLSERNRALKLLCTATSLVNRSFKKDSETQKLCIEDPMIGINSDDPYTDPLGPYTQECHGARMEVRDTINDSVKLRYEVKDIIQNIQKLLKDAHEAVNKGLVKKVAETISLAQDLSLAHGASRHALFRAQKWYDITDRARTATMGPDKYADLTCRERLTRPLVSIYQRHTGTQLPEPAEVQKASEGLLESMVESSRQIGLLKLSKRNLHKDFLSKRSGAETDSDVFRFRRRKADHRWITGPPFCTFST